MVTDILKYGSKPSVILKCLWTSHRLSIAVKLHLNYIELCNKPETSGKMFI